MYDLIVIGGGAAGLMAAGTAASRGRNVLLLEKMEKTGRKVGFKAAGGVRSAEDAALYYTIVKEILGEEWLTTDLFRIGASSAANNLLSAIEGEEIKYF